MIFQWKLKVENFIFTQLNNLQLNLCWLFFFGGGVGIHVNMFMLEIHYVI